MAKRIPVSFKENPRDERLYTYVINEDDKSCFIKKAIEFYINHLNSKSIPAVQGAVSVVEFENEEDGFAEIMGI